MSLHFVCLFIVVQVTERHQRQEAVSLPVNIEIQRKNPSVEQIRKLWLELN